MKVSPLVSTADIVGVADNAPPGHSCQGSGVILNIKPIADVLAVAINGVRLLC